MNDDLTFFPDHVTIRCSECGDVDTFDFDGMLNEDEMHASFEADGWVIMDTFCECEKCYAGEGDNYGPEHDGDAPPPGIGV